MIYVNIVPQEEQMSLNGGQTGSYRFYSDGSTRLFTVIDIDTTTQDWGLAVWFSDDRYFLPLRYVNFKTIESVQQMKPLVVSINDHTPVGVYHIKTEPGTYFLNIENRTNEVKTFLFKEIIV